MFRNCFWGDKAVMNAPATNKSLGQHWLNDNATLQRICDASNLSADDVVLEVGPGPGALTSLLVKRASRVVAVEFDEQLAHQLPARVIAKNLEVVNQDILQFDLTQLPSDYKVVANIPYYLTSKLVRTLSEAANPPQSVTLLIQKEVARRLAAKPGDMSLLGVSAQYYWQVALDIEVPARMFTPPPKVDSQVVVMVRRPSKLFGQIDESSFFRIVKAGFSARRKKLRSSLAGGLRMNKDEAEDLLVKANIDPNLRAQNLSLEDWYSIYKVVNER